MMDAVPTDFAYASTGWVRRGVRHAVTLRPVAWLSARALPRLDRATVSLTRGRWTASGVLTGLPVVELVTIGARSGIERSSRVLGIPTETGFVLVAANFGQAANPAWYHNLVAHPQVRVIAEGEAAEYQARVLRGPERTARFEVALALNPGWRRSQMYAGDRAIPVVKLTRQDD